ncbi:MAG: hypothetical protein KBF98_00640 [Rhodoferax sp.]|nr:hypothetical protein [Rhodoferax sp.]
MTPDSPLTQISLGDFVRFQAERLAMLAPADRRRLEGRVGLVQGYWNSTRKLTVAFAQDGGRAELRILSVDPRQLERVVDTPMPTAAEANIPEPTDGDAKLSQEDTDNLFG